MMAKRWMAAATVLAAAGCAGGDGGGSASDPNRGFFIYFADAAVFEPCGGGRLPVAQEGAYLDAEQAYLAARPGPAEPVYMRLSATVEERESMEGPPQPHLVIAAFQDADAAGGCP